MERIQIISSHLTQENCSSTESNNNQDFPGPWKQAHPKWGNSKIIAEYFFQGSLPELLQQWQLEYGNIFKFINYELDTKMLRENLVIADMKEANRLLKLNPPKPDSYSRLRLLGHGVLSQYDPVEWSRQREILKPIFSSEALRRLVPVMEGGTKTMEQFLKEKAHLNQSFDFHEIMSNIAFELIGHSALGEESSFLKQNATSLREAFETILKKGFLGEDLNEDPEFKEADDILRNFSTQVFDRYKKSGEGKCPVHHNQGSKNETSSSSSSTDSEPPSAISVILGKDEKGNPNFDERQKYDQLSTFVFAGHETTANTLSFIVLELARNHDVQSKLRKDIHDTCKKLNITVDKISYKDLFKFNYLTLVINEGLRMWPVVAMGTVRILEEDTVIDGKIAKKGVMLRFPHYLIHRNPSYWEQPNKFIPERKWNNEAFLPFSRQPRDCLGRNLALLEMRMFLISMITQFSFELADPSQDLSGFEGGTMKPRNAQVKVKELK